MRVCFSNLNPVLMCSALLLLFQMSFGISLPNSQGEIACTFGQVGLIVLYLHTSKQTIWQDTHLLVIAAMTIALGVCQLLTAVSTVQSSQCTTVFW